MQLKLDFIQRVT